MKHCTTCGAALLDGFRFCVQCGATVEAAEPAPADPVAASIAETPVVEKNAPETPDADSGMPEYVPVPDVSEPVISEPAPVYTEPAPVYTAPVFTVPAATPVAPAAPVIDERSALSFSGAFVALLLFCIPGVNLITAFIWAVGGAKNRSRKNLSRAYLLLVLAFVLFFGCMGLLVWLFAKEQVLDLIAVVRDAAAAYGIPF